MFNKCVLFIVSFILSSQTREDAGPSSTIYLGDLKYLDFSDTCDGTTKKEGDCFLTTKIRLNWNI